MRHVRHVVRGIAFGLVMAGLLAATSAAGAAVRYVNVALSTGLNDGSSWANAHQGAGGLAAALAAAGSGDQIWVAKGVYKPTTTTTRTIAFTLKNGVELYGGFTGGETALDQRNFSTNKTILSGDLLGNDPPGSSFNNDGDNSYHVVDAASSDASAILDGFTVSGGNGNGSNSLNQTKGGAILCMSASDSAIRNCVFFHNRCTVGGGAGFIDHSSPTFTDCVFQNNVGGMFGGAFDMAFQSATTFTRCQFIGNAAADGSAVNTFSVTPAFTNCVFRGNSATGASGGGALYVGTSSNVNVRLCTFTGNATTSNFAGIYVKGQATISNCIVWGNVGPGGSQASDQQIKSGGGLAIVSYCDVQGGFPVGTNNFGLNPLFIDVAAGDLRLAAGSPCIDAGNNAAVLAGTTTDLDGLSRFVDDSGVADTGAGTAPIVDMGAHERQIASPPFCPVDISPPGAGNGIIDVDDLFMVINAWGPCANPGDCPADLAPAGGDDVVDVDDLFAVINHWGACP